MLVEDGKVCGMAGNLWRVVFYFFANSYFCFFVM